MTALSGTPQSEAATVEWIQRGESSLNRETLALLLGNKVAAIHVKDFASADECESLLAAIRRARPESFKQYSYGRPAWYIGLTQIEYRRRPKAAYFADVAAAYADQREVFGRSWDPVDRLLTRLEDAAAGPVSVAAEPGYGRYFAGIIRNTSHGIEFHADHAPYFARGWATSAIDAQLGLNLYVGLPSAGGETTVYDRRWVPTMHDEGPRGRPSFDRAIVAGAGSYTFRPEPGEVVMIYNQNFHEVAAGRSPETDVRVTVSVHVGRTETGALIVWS